MAGGRWFGKRIGLLRAIREHEDEVEADFARFYPGIDYRDRYRRNQQGRPRLSVRRLLLLVDRLPPESWFASEMAERYPLSREQAALYDVYAALAGEKHPYPTALKQQRDRARKAELIAAKKADRQAQNTRYMAAARRAQERR